jgi:transglutaminase-like putative cysteine protease
MERRKFLQLGASAAICGGAASIRPDDYFLQSLYGPAPPVYSIVPVVGDGKWIWTAPPKNQTGYLEPRAFKLKIGIELNGQGSATQIQATTPAPIECPEQKLDEPKIETQGCEAEIRDVGADARQLLLSAAQIIPGQMISATATYNVTAFKQYQAYRRDQFPLQQKPPRDIVNMYMGDSPGIQTRIKQVRKLLEELIGDTKHPWDLAQTFANWIPHHIKPLIRPYTSVAAALDDRQGACAEMSAVFVALCRSAGIPARLVWVPDHNWAEFYLLDEKGLGHWIPAHTACYFWFGWTGAHELVLQKGDRLRMPDRGNRLFRLQEDWMQWLGRRPKVRYLAEWTPLPASPGADAGPGAREKMPNGEWKVVGKHPLDQYARR